MYDIFIGIQREAKTKKKVTCKKTAVAQMDTVFVQN